MSHFTVLVIGGDLERQLAPFHEFECTGIDDEYVQDVDRTAEAIASYESATVTRLRAPDGELHEIYDLQGNYKSEFSKETIRGRRELSIPPGWEEVMVSAKDNEVAAQWISGYYGWNVLTLGNAPSDAHKGGRIEVDADGNVVRCIDRTNPNSKWDWWVLGGRWSGHFKLKPGAVATLSPRKGYFDEPQPAPGNDRADEARKGDIDFDGMRADAAEKAGAKWDKIRAITGPLDDFISWPKMRDEVHVGNIEAAREAYHSQPAKQAINEAAKTDRDLVWIELDPFIAGRDEYVQSARDNSAVTYAVLKDGKWYERGQMGWWGCASNEKDRDQWCLEFSTLIDELPDDTILSVVDCHI